MFLIVSEGDLKTAKHHSPELWKRYVHQHTLTQNMSDI